MRAIRFFGAPFFGTATFVAVSVAGIALLMQFLAEPLCARAGREVVRFQLFGNRRVAGSSLRCSYADGTAESLGEAASDAAVVAVIATTIAVFVLAGLLGWLVVKRSLAGVR